MHGDKTFVLIKPDAIERGLTGEILHRFERKGFRIIKAEMRYVTEDLAKKHYAEHQGNQSYFSKMIDAITCGPVIAMILEGPNAVVAARQLIGNADPGHSHVGTIRGDLATEVAYNLVHGADSDQSVIREIGLWFGEEEIKEIFPKKSQEWWNKYHINAMGNNAFISTIPSNILYKEPEVEVNYV